MSKAKGFTLVDVIIGVGLIVLVFLALFGAYQLTMKLVGQSKNRVSAITIANQKIEEFRNKIYSDVKSSTGEIILNNINYSVTTTVHCIDSDVDEKAPNDANNCICDYKKVRTKVSWSGLFGGEVEQRTIISPRTKTEECEEPRGILDIEVFDAKGGMVDIDCPNVEVENINTGVSQSCNKVATGKFEFIVEPGSDLYAVTTTQSNYTWSKTFGSGEVYHDQTIANPENECWAHSHQSVFDAQRTEVSFCIDKQSTFLINTLEAKAENIYYVREVGSDDSDGLSPDSAFRTIQKAASTTQAGDMVFVGAGTYDEEINIPNSGASGEKIVLVADIEGNYTGDAGPVVIDGLDYGFYIDGQKYIQLYGFEITSASSSGIEIREATARNIEVINNKIHDNPGYGIHAINNSKNITISHNSIYENGFTQEEEVCAGEEAKGIQLEDANSSTLVGNEIYENGCGGVGIMSCLDVSLNFNEVYSNSRKGILIDDQSNNGQVKNNLIFLNEGNGIEISYSNSPEVINNKSYSNQGFGIILKGSANTPKTISNLVYNNATSGLAVSDHCRNVIIYNNTSYKNEENGFLVTDSNNIKLKDNIAVKNSIGIKVSGSTNVESTYSDVWENDSNYDGIEAGEGSISVDPKFIDPDESDLHLAQVESGQSETSEAVDAGSDLASALGMDDKTTRTDEVTDSGIVDMGFHYSLQFPPPVPDPPDPFGEAIPKTTFHLRGEKAVGADAEDNSIYKYSATNTTDNEGKLTLPDMEWDDYYFSNFSAAGQELDLIISYPSPMPIFLEPNTTTTVKLGLRAENTLLVKVRDEATAEPVAFAQVRTYDTNYDQTKITGEEGEAYFIPLPQDWYTVETSASGYASSTDSVHVTGHQEITVQLSLE